jgi:hypothetical protein
LAYFKSSAHDSASCTLGESEMEDIEKVLNRHKEYENIDGLQELSVGLFWVSWAFLMGLLQFHVPKSSIWNSTYALNACWIPLALILYFGGKAFKKHITYPRTGYVEYRVKNGKRWVVLLVTFGAGMFVSSGVALFLFQAIRHHFSISTFVPFFSLVLAAGYLRIAWKRPWKWAFFLAMLAGTLATTMLPRDWLDEVAGHNHIGAAVSSQALGAFWLAWAVNGALMLLSGLTTFWLYLRHTQAPAQESR